MASSRVQALLERTKNLAKGGAEPKSQVSQSLPNPPPQVTPLLIDSNRDRSPTFSAQEPPAASKPSGPLLSIKERVASALPQVQSIAPRFTTPPKPVHRPSKPPKSGDSRPSPGRSLSVPKRQSSPANRSFAEVVFEREKLPALDQLISEVTESRRALQAQMQAQFAREKQLVELLKASTYKGDPRKRDSPESQEQLSRIEEYPPPRSYKEKTQKLLSAVKDEVMVMDRKLADLLQENAKLKELVVLVIQANKAKEERTGSRSSSRSGFSDKREKPLTASEAVLDTLESQLKPTQESEYISHNDSQIKHLFSNLEQTSSTEAYRELCILLAKKMIFERRHRLKTETQAHDMMDQQERTISNLKDKLSQYDGRSSAQLSLRESPREEVHPFTEDSAAHASA